MNSVLYFQITDNYFCLNTPDSIVIGSRKAATGLNKDKILQFFRTILQENWDKEELIGHNFTCGVRELREYNYSRCNTAGIPI